MSLDPAAERAHVYATYAPSGRRELLFVLVLAAAVCVASRFIHIDWFACVGVLVFAGLWEITKFRLRRNADHFLEKQRRRVD